MRENIFERLSSMKAKNKGIITHTIKILKELIERVREKQYVKK